MASNATETEIRELARYLGNASGIELDESKGYLFEARLSRVADEQGCQTLTALLDKARRDTTGQVRGILVDAISTNETSFFREPQQFHLLAQKLVPDHFDRASTTRCRIWCAAASTGQESYSIAITLKELFGSFERHQIQILGTDISAAALERASRAIYSPLEVSRGLSPERLRRHFEPRDKGWVISEELRATATFQRLNLLEPAPTLGTFDIIFCRNVAIYFSATNRINLFANLAKHLRRGGALVVSMTETLGSRPGPFVRREFRGVTYYELT
ncbi:MAG TPA: protein-glutamate O-methyltransferase CheR [Polyangiaceae bacterium]